MNKLNELKAFEISNANETKGGAIKTGKESGSTGWDCYTDNWYLFKKNNESKNDSDNDHLDHFEPVCNP